MTRPMSVTHVFSCAFLVLLWAAFSFGDESTAETRLRKQAEQFPEKIIKVADGVYTAVGYSVSNVSMIVGDDGVIIMALQKNLWVKSGSCSKVLWT